MAGPEGNERRDEISRVKAQHEEDLLKLPNVTGVYTDYKTTGGQRTDRLSIVVTVRQKKDVPKTQTIPKEINGIPTDVVEEEIVPMVGMLVDDIAPAVDAATYATLEGGISIGPCRSVHLDPPEVPASGDYVFVGTLGCIVRDNVTNAAMMLSNFHVMCINDAWSAGDTMTQPSRVDGGSCPGGVVGTLTRAVIDQSVDAAVATVSGRPTSCSITEIGDINGTAVASVGLTVRKRGRTTGLTHGTVTATDYTTSVDYGDGIGVVTLKNQIRIVNDPVQSSQFGNRGDSGSVVVNDSNEVIGLYFAGNVPTGTVGVANPIATVLTALNVSMCSNIVKKIEHKEIVKEWLNEKWFIKHEIKEIEKQRFKDLLKDWKEFAYEKFGAFEDIDPWERLRPPDVVFEPPVGRPPVLGGPRTIGRGSLEERVARLEGWAPAADIVPMGDPSVESGCIDFTRAAPGPGPNPVNAAQYSVLVLDHTGTPPPNTEVVTWGAHTGLNAGFTLEAKIRGRCPVVQATLVHFSQPAVMEAFESDGTSAGTASMSPTQGVAQTLTIQGKSIAFVRIHAPANETLLLRLCCCAELVCRPDKADKEFKEPKEIKEPKEFKEFPKEISKEIKEQHKEFLPKEFKEVHKDIKEPIKEIKEPIKEIKEPNKELKELPKEIKEGKEIREGPGELQPSLPRASLEDRVAYLESMLAGPGHFIPSEARPDLSRGALRYEAGGPPPPPHLRHRG